MTYFGDPRWPYCRCHCTACCCVVPGAVVFGPAPMGFVPARNGIDELEALIEQIKSGKPLQLTEDQAERYAEIIEDCGYDDLPTIVRGES